MVLFRKRSQCVSAICITEIPLAYLYDSYLATSAAMLTIFALAIDPLSQHILVFDSYLQPNANAQALVPRASQYSRTGGGRVEFYGSIDTASAISIHAGAMGPPQNASSLISARCDTGTSNTTTPVNSAIILNTMIANVPLQDGFARLHSLHLFGTNKAAAYSCTLFMCLNTYGANITNGVLTENLLPMTPMTLMPYTPLNVAAAYRLASDRILKNGQWKECTSYPNNQSADGLVSIGTTHNTTLLWGEVGWLDSFSWRWYPAE
jgi:hypothetical protein